MASGATTASLSLHAQPAMMHMYSQPHPPPSSSVAIVRGRPPPPPAAAAQQHHASSHLPTRDDGAAEAEGPYPLQFESVSAEEDASGRASAMGDGVAVAVAPSAPVSADSAQEE